MSDQRRLMSHAVFMELTFVIVIWVVRRRISSRAFFRRSASSCERLASFRSMKERASSTTEVTTTKSTKIRPEDARPSCYVAWWHSLLPDLAVSAGTSNSIAAMGICSSKEGTAAAAPPSASNGVSIGIVFICGIFPASSHRRIYSISSVLLFSSRR